MKILISIIQSIIAGIPLLKSIKEIVLPTKIVIPTRDANGNVTTPQTINVNDSSIIQKIIMLIIEFASVYATIYIMKHFNISYNDIITIFGLFK